jgi:hypothetical protein
MNENDFILKYDIDMINDEKIIRVYYASNNAELIIPYDVETEREILKKMKEQAINQFESKDCYEAKISDSAKMTAFVALITLCNFPLFKVLALINIKFAVALGLVLGLECTRNIYNIINNKKAVNEINKNYMFLENEEIINKKVNENKNLLSNSTEKVKKMVNSVSDNQPSFTINSIDKLSLRELKQVLSNIKCAEELECEYSNAGENPVKRLTKNIENR